jgi:uncharacterized protein involved in exopolysaccharide biosynthesis
MMAAGESPHGYAARAEEHPRRRYPSVLMRRNALLVALATLGALGGVGAALVMKPESLAEATVWVEWKGRSGADQGPFAPPELLQSYDWVDLLKSYSVLEHVAWYP